MDLVASALGRTWEVPVHPRTELYRTASASLARGERAALATVVATRGSTPQKSGASLLMLSDGTMHGTIGGGCVEADVWAEAQRLMRRGESGLREFVLADDPDHPGGDVCGGTMEVFIDVLLPASHGEDTVDQAGQSA